MHVWRPLFVVLGIVALILVARQVIVPKDFGVYGKGYTYGWHRKSNEAEWKAIKPKYRGREYCTDCHEEQIKSHPWLSPCADSVRELPRSSDGPS